ncbi:MAG: hypothetical protein J6T35_00125 [Bacteroidales bacterium]|nr:hypothetical protein [Bacteroidales bacterium]
MSDLATQVTKVGLQKYRNKKEKAVGFGKIFFDFLRLRKNFYSRKNANGKKVKKKKNFFWFVKLIVNYIACAAYALRYNKQTERNAFFNTLFANILTPQRKLGLTLFMRRAPFGVLKMDVDC